MPEYGQSPWAGASSAMGGLGDSMSRIAMAQQIGKQRAQQFAQQQALEQAYLRIAQEKQRQEGKMDSAKVAEMGASTGQIQQQTDAAKTNAMVAAMIGRLRAQQQSPMRGQMSQGVPGMQMGQDLSRMGVIPQDQMSYARKDVVGLPPEQLEQALNAAISGGLYQQAAQSPAVAGRMTEPISVQPNSTLLDPVSMQKILQTGPGPITPYQQALLGYRGQSEDIAKERLKDEQLRTKTDIERLRTSPNFQLYGDESFTDEADSQAPDKGSSPTGGGQPIDERTAAAFMKLSNGDPNKAREMARKAGYKF